MVKKNKKNVETLATLCFTSLNLVYFHRQRVYYFGQQTFLQIKRLGSSTFQLNIIAVKLLQKFGFPYMSEPVSLI